ncbi:MAG: hypothetical protein HOP19_14470, partial [Acidobacteria bacterium]|nr:hypothetical protein [Acidobacteriota bacterium]
MFTRLASRNTVQWWVVIALGWFVFALSEYTHANAQDVEMLTSAPLLKTLAGGQTHTYQLHVEARQYFRIIVEQRGADIVLTLADHEGKPLYEIDSPNGTEGTEEIPFVTSQASRYRISVSNPDKQAAAGQYVIRLDELRPATEADEHRSNGERAEAKADWFARRNQAAASRQAIPLFETAAREYQAAGDAGKELD